ncbi:MAG: sigma 54-interacting transcriptional regulator [Polyangia bacterium]
MLTDTRIRAVDLELDELLDIHSTEGVIRFAGERALLIDALALGLLRKQLAETLGLGAARLLLTRFGYAHGWRMAEALDRTFHFRSQDEWRDAGGRIHALQGLLRLDANSSGPLSPAGATVHGSYEAEQHILHLGRAAEPVCWTLAGFASGYLSRTEGQPIYVIEDRCVGAGAAVCRFAGRSQKDWGPALAEHLPFFAATELDPSLVRAAAALDRSVRRLQRLRAGSGGAAAGDAADGGVVARSAGMRALLEVARRVAPVDSTVLITGESGAGKERIARLVHAESARAAGPFVAVNCAAIAETLLESELFGHARGAFTGAQQDRAGLFEAAHGGTLFLDEIGDVPRPMQARLLRALQERTVRRIGENHDRAVNVRFVAATNADLAGAVAAGQFRKDLYYRLRVIELHVPPLRERRDDILPLARAFLATAARRLGQSSVSQSTVSQSTVSHAAAARSPARPPLGLTPAAADLLLGYAWPGNVRELENAMERAVALARGRRIDVDDLPPDVRSAGGGGAGTTLAEIERRHILAALERNAGSRSRTAAELGISASTLYRKLREAGR